MPPRVFFGGKCSTYTVCSHYKKSMQSLIMLGLGYVIHSELLINVIVN